MENLIDCKNLLSMISDGANPKNCTSQELDLLSDYVITEGIKYETLPDSLKFNTAFASKCKQRGIILPDIVMYYCFN
jgi:hypothetical protein